MVPTADVPDLGALCIEEGMDVNVQYRQYDTGVGSPKIRLFNGKVNFCLIYILATRSYHSTHLPYLV